MESLIIALLIIVAYLLPGIIASNRKHHNSTAIWLVNIFAGWSVLGWFIALVWAVTNPAPKV